MAPPKQLWLSSFIAYFYILHVCPSHTLVSAAYSYDNVFQYQYQNSENIPHTNYSVYPGFNYQCGHNLRLKKLTKTFIVSENPFWSAYYGSLFFIGGPGNNICRYAVHTQQLFCVNLTAGDTPIRDVIPIRNVPHKYLSTYGNNLTILTWDAKSTNASFQTLKEADRNRSLYVNEAKVGPRGILFFYIDPPIPSTGLYTLSQNQATLYNIVNGKQRALLSKLYFGNGMGFSPDEKFFYYSDSVLNRTYEACYDPTSQSLKDTRMLIDYGKSCFPDSLTVDREGYIWIACHGNYHIIKLEPHTGRIVCSITLPANSPSNLAFGECPGQRNGKLECLYVLSLRGGLSSPTQYDGAVYLVENTGSEGILPHKLDPNELFAV